MPLNQRNNNKSYWLFLFAFLLLNKKSEICKQPDSTVHFLQRSQNLHTFPYTHTQTYVNIQGRTLNTIYAVNCVCYHYVRLQVCQDLLSRRSVPAATYIIFNFDFSSGANETSSNVICAVSGYCDSSNSYVCVCTIYTYVVYMARVWPYSSLQIYK